MTIANAVLLAVLGGQVFSVLMMCWHITRKKELENKKKVLKYGKRLLTLCSNFSRQ